MFLEQVLDSTLQHAALGRASVGSAERAGQPREVVGGRCVAVQDHGKESQAKEVIEEDFKRKK